MHVNFGSGLPSPVRLFFPNLIKSFSIELRLQGGMNLMPHLTQSLVAISHPKIHPTQIQIHMTFAIRPHALFSTFQVTPDYKS